MVDTQETDHVLFYDIKYISSDPTGNFYFYLFIWLPVSQIIDFKVLLLVFKSLHGLGPKYIVELQYALLTC